MHKYSREKGVGVQTMISKRTYLEIGKFWCVEKGQDLKNLVYNTLPKMRFKCKEIASYSNTNQNVAEVFMMRMNTITIEVPENLPIKTNDIVEFRETKWRVNGVQKVRDKGDTQYRRRGEYKTILLLIGATI